MHRVAGGPGNVPGRDLRRRFPDNQRQLQMAALSLSPARPTNQVQPAAGCPACTKCGRGGDGEGDQRDGEGHRGGEGEGHQRDTRRTFLASQDALEVMPVTE